MHALLHSTPNILNILKIAALSYFWVCFPGILDHFVQDMPFAFEIEGGGDTEVFVDPINDMQELLDFCHHATLLSNSEIGNI